MLITRIEPHHITTKRQPYKDLFGIRKKLKKIFEIISNDERGKF